MKEAIDVISKEWFFSGLGTEIFGWVLGIVSFIITSIWGYKKLKNANTQISGDHSQQFNNVKVGRNLIVKNENRKGKKEVKKKNVRK